MTHKQLKALRYLPQLIGSLPEGSPEYQRAKSEYDRLSAFVEDIQDDQTRDIFRLYYVRRWTWQRIALKYGWSDESTPRRICKNYFQNPENPDFANVK